jgi:hypothetical protein
MLTKKSATRVTGYSEQALANAHSEARANTAERVKKHRAKPVPRGTRSVASPKHPPRDDHAEGAERWERSLGNVAGDPSHSHLLA